MFLSTHPQNTKKTRCDNNLRNDNNNRNNDFFRPIISNPQVPMSFNHDQYFYDNNIYDQTNNFFNDIERSSISTRNKAVESKTPVQSNFQNNYFTMNYETFNNNLQYNDIEANKIYTRNPVNTRRDLLEKERNSDKQDFLKLQGGYANGVPEFKFETTRRGKYEINSSSYVPMPKTMAIPKEKI
jgi:hypothetical protein